MALGARPQEAGTLSVTNLLTPKQTGSSDMCAATNEEEVFAHQFENGLMTLGWIHVRASACGHVPRGNPVWG